MNPKRRKRDTDLETYLAPSIARAMVRAFSPCLVCANISWGVAPGWNSVAPLARWTLARWICVEVTLICVEVIALRANGPSLFQHGATPHVLERINQRANGPHHPIRRVAGTPRSRCQSGILLQNPRKRRAPLNVRRRSEFDDIGKGLNRTEESGISNFELGTRNSELRTPHRASYG
jgi:hypothetical protein